MSGSISRLSVLLHWSVFCQYHTVLIAIALWWVFKSGSISSPIFFFFFFALNIVLSILDLLFHCINFRISLSISTNDLLGFWLRLHWIYRSHWEKLTLWQYWIFLSMNMPEMITFLMFCICIYPKINKRYFNLEMYWYHY